MAHLYKTVEWAGGSGIVWYVNDVQELGTDAGKWWVPLKILNITKEEYIDLLINTFSAKVGAYNEQADELPFSFSSLAAARKYKNWINKKSREKNYIVGK